MTVPAGRRPRESGAIVDVGPYRNALPIAVGGMAEVFRALKPQPAGADRAVVIKRLLPELAEDAGHRAMFEREGRLGRAIRHPNVVEVLDHGGGDQPYLVLEYVFGVDLRALGRWASRLGQPLAPSIVAFLATEMLAGLDAVHTAKGENGEPLEIVHRDVSPSNVFLSVHGEVKLGDLGIARPGATGPRAMGLALGERSERAKGKLGYLAPEQVAGVPIDARADIFAAAVVIAELVIGEPLFSATTELDTLLKIRDADLTPLRAVTSSQPPGFVQALLPALAREPEQRTAHAATLRAAFLPFLTGTAPQLRRELGRLVVAALDATGPRTDRTSLAPTIDGSSPLAAAAIAADTSSTRISDRPHAEPSASRYEILAGARRLGPWPFARVVQALRTGEVDPSATVRVDGGPQQSVTDRPELVRHLPSYTRTPSGRTPTAPLPVGPVRNLSSGGLVPLLARAWLDRTTGIVRCERGATRKEIHLDAGVPTFVTSNQLDELLGEQLLRAKVIDRAELDAALAVLPRFEGRLGDALVALGLVEPLALFRHLATQVREKLLEIFTWPDGRAAVFGPAERAERGFPIDLDPFSLLEAGVVRRIGAGLEPKDVLERRLLHTLVAESPVLLPAQIDRLLELLRTPRSIDEIAGIYADPVRTRAAVTVLLALDLVRVG